MVKEKKLTKSSIAIIVLALLLVASLIMGMTGAWFTDYVKTSDDQTIKFGNIDIEAAVTEIAQGNWEHALPGDTAVLAGTVTVKANSEPMYVLVMPTSSLKDGQNALALYYAKTTGENPTADTTKPILTISFADGTAPDTWHAVALSGEGSASYTGTLYYVESAASDKALPLAGAVTFDEHTTNIAYNASGEEVRLNVDNPEISLTMEIGVEAKAIQARNAVTPTVETGNFAKLTYAEANALVAKMTQLPAQAPANNG